MTSRASVPRVALIALALSCVKEISNEERLEREISRPDVKKSSTAADLAKLKCDDINAELIKANDASRSEEARLNTYISLFDKARERNQKFEEALNRNPDLRYQAGSEDVVATHEGCIQSQADVRLDLENLVREVTQMPTVDEIRGGSTVKVARLKFDVIRDAIDALDLDDKETLQARLNSAERQLDDKPEGGSRRKREK